MVWESLNRAPVECSRLHSGGAFFHIWHQCLRDFIAVCLIFTATLAQATDTNWTGTTNATWGTGSNWITGGKPGTNDNAVFNGTFSNQPNLTSNQNIGGIWMTNSAGQNVTISGSNTLTLGGNTINGVTKLGLLVDNTNPYTLTINPSIKLGADETWRNNSGNLLTVAGAINGNGKTLTVDGTGTTTISGVVSAGGSIAKTGTGTLTLSGANTFTGSTTINAGALAAAATSGGR